jgi:hypothetical protein
LFLNQGCLFSSDEVILGNSPQSSTTARSPKAQASKQTTEYLRRYADFFADFCLQEDSFIFVNPQQLACAIIAFARKYTRLTVIYPLELELLTG